MPLWMNNAMWFLLGGWAGAIISLITISLCTASAKSNAEDEIAERLKELLIEEEQRIKG